MTGRHRLKPTHNEALQGLAILVVVFVAMMAIAIVAGLYF